MLTVKTELAHYQPSFKIYSNSNQDFESAIHLTLTTLHQDAIGRKLLDRLITSLKDRILNICDNSYFPTCEPEYDPLSNTLFISNKVKVFYVSRGVIYPHPFSITFAHELFHVLNFYEDPKSFDQRLNSTAHLLHPRFSNKEEEYVITGAVDGDHEFCENALLTSFNLPPRDNHQDGILLKSVSSVEDLTLDHLIFAQATLSVKTYLSKKPEALNALYKIDWMQGVYSVSKASFAGKKLLPMTFALLLKREDIIDHLMGLPIQAALKDDFDGPIATACKCRNFIQARKLIEKLPLQTRIEQIKELKLLELILTSSHLAEVNDDDNGFASLLLSIHTQLTRETNVTSIQLLDVIRTAIPNYQIAEMIRIILRDNFPIEGVDSLGSSLVVIVLEKMKELPKFAQKSNLSNPLFPLVAQLFQLITRTPLSLLSQQNHHGATALSIAEEIGSALLIQALKERLGT